MIGENRMRQRQSYKLFDCWLKFLTKKPSKAAILRKLYVELDHRHSFGSVRNSDAAAESLMLALKDGRRVEE